MRKLLVALIAGAFAAVTFGAVAADEKPYTAQPASQKPGRAADDTKQSVKTGGDMTKPGRAADEDKAPPKKKSKKKKAVPAEPAK
jgi:hypothetical protein